MRTRRTPQSKPPVGARLDRAHPLAAGLVAFVPLNQSSAAGVIDLVSGLSLGMLANARWDVDSAGSALYCYDVGGGASGTIPPGSPLLIVPPFTLAAALTWDGTVPTAGSFMWGTSVSNASTGTSAYRLMLTTSGSDAEFGCQMASVASATYVMTAGQRITGFVTVQSTGSTLVIIPDGGATSIQANTVTVPVAAYTSTAQLQVGAQAGFTPRAAHCRISWAAMYNRLLGLTEMSALAADPWQLLARRRGIRPVFSRRTLSGRAGSRGLA
jgi:hypothetical protein